MSGPSSGPAGQAPAPLVLLAATGNAGKLRELRELLGPRGIEVRGLDSLRAPPALVEDGATFADNARAKARALQRATGLPTVADDSGLVVEALDGRPGVYSARYAAADLRDRADARARDHANCQKLLAELDGVPDERRAARFVCVLCYIDAAGAERCFEGVCAGAIGHHPRGAGGFGYDPLFVLPDGRTMAELPAAAKNALSHRGQAVRALLSWLGRAP